MLSNVLISKSRFPALACIAVVVCAPSCVLANVVAIFLVISGHHEKLGVGVGKLDNLDIVTIARSVSAWIGR